MSAYVRRRSASAPLLILLSSSFLLFSLPAVSSCRLPYAERSSPLSHTYLPTHHHFLAVLAITTISFSLHTQLGLLNEHILF